MTLTGLDALRRMVVCGGPIAWDGRIITNAEAEQVLNAVGKQHEAMILPALPALKQLVQPTEDMITARIAACTTCEYYRKEADKCGICGCGAIVSQRSKSPLGSCPKGKWDQ